MRQCMYAQEPFDLRLLILRMKKKIGILLLITIAGTLIMGGGYYVQKILLAPEDTYGKQSIYCVEYVDPPVLENNFTFYNTAAWQNILLNEAFLKDVGERFQRITGEEAPESYLSVNLPSDYRMLLTLVTTQRPELSVQLAAAVEESVIALANQMEDIKSIRVVDSPASADITFVDVRPMRAFILSAVVSFFFGAVFLLAREISHDGIWLPAMLNRRYGLKELEIIESGRLAEDVRYLFGGCRKIAVACVDADVQPRQVIDKFHKHNISNGEEAEWLALEDEITQWKGGINRLQADGILLVVGAGRHNGKKIEEAMTVITKTDKATAALLWEADTELIDRYYKYKSE